MREAEEGGPAARVLDVARAELGYVETPTNITKYWAELEPGLQGSAWCAAFVSWCFIHADQALPAIDRPYGYIDCTDGMNHFRDRGRFFAEPEPGDVAVYLTASVAVHTGIVESVGDDGSFTAIEGNTSSDEAGSQVNGGQVCRKDRHVSQVAGFGRRDYEGVNELKTDEREALLKVTAFVTDLQQAMTDEKEGRFSQPRLDQLDREIAALAAKVDAIAAKVGASA